MGLREIRKSKNLTQRELLFQAQDIELESQFAFGFTAGMMLQWEAANLTKSIK